MLDTKTLKKSGRRPAQRHRGKKEPHTKAQKHKDQGQTWKISCTMIQEKKRITQRRRGAKRRRKKKSSHGERGGTGITEGRGETQCFCNILLTDSKFSVIFVVGGSRKPYMRGRSVWFTRWAMFPDYGFFILYRKKSYIFESVIPKFCNIINSFPDGDNNPKIFSINLACTLK